MEFPFSIVLASSSPRRIELIKMLGINLIVEPTHVNEDYPKHLSPYNVSVFLAEKKMHAAALNFKPETVLITADTVVGFNNKVYNKPDSPEDAFQMLTELSGNTHEVHTSVCIKTKFDSTTITDTARVTFTNLSPSEIEFYLTTCKPFDKAGSYGVQDWLGLCCIKQIEGNYYTVMGLPVYKLYEKLKSINSVWF